MKSSKRKGEIIFLFLLLFILSLLITQIVMAIRQSQSEAIASPTSANISTTQTFID